MRSEGVQLLLTSQHVRQEGLEAVSLGDDGHVLGEGLGGEDHLADPGVVTGDEGVVNV